MSSSICSIFSGTIYILLSLRIVMILTKVRDKIWNSQIYLMPVSLANFLIWKNYVIHFEKSQKYQWFHKKKQYCTNSTDVHRVIALILEVLRHQIREFIFKIWRYLSGISKFHSVFLIFFIFKWFSNQICQFFFYIPITYAYFLLYCMDLP